MQPVILERFAPFALLYQHGRENLQNFFSASLVRQRPAKSDRTNESIMAYVASLMLAMQSSPIANRFLTALAASRWDDFEKLIDSSPKASKL
jgi:hypothetical protein